MIATSLQDKGVPRYICRLLDDYFDNRVLVYKVAGVTRTRDLTAGVPQVSVLGLTLWNFLCDGLLRLFTHDGVEIVACADDIAVVARAAVTFRVGELLEETTEAIVDKPAEIGIELALEKTELIIPMRKKTHNTLQIRAKGQLIESWPSVKYLGVHLDQKVNFRAHASWVAKKADSVTRSLRAILSNNGGPRQHARKLLAAVSHSMMMYGAPIWSHNMSAGGMWMLSRCQRRIALRYDIRRCALGAGGIPHRFVGG